MTVGVRQACWPVSQRLQIPPSKRAKFLGPGGINIKRISGDTGVQIHPEQEEGTWTLFGRSQEMLEEAELLVAKLLEEQKPLELEFGAIYSGRILELRNTGVLLTLQDGIIVLIFLVQPSTHSGSLRWRGDVPAQQSAEQ